MNKQSKILVFGGIGLAVITFIAFRVFAKKPKIKLVPRPYIPVTPIQDDYMQISQVLSVVTKNGTRLRSEPSTSSDILETFSEGITLYVIDNTIKDDGLWYNVDDGEFLVGWVRSDVVDDLQVIRNYEYE